MEESTKVDSFSTPFQLGDKVQFVPNERATTTTFWLPQIVGRVLDDMHLLTDLCRHLTY